MPDAELLEDVIAIVARVCERSDVGPESRLSDLGIDGQDGGEVLREIAAKHPIDFSGFHFLRYFGDEGMDFFQPFFVMVARLISRDFDARWRTALDAEREISVRHLALVAEAGRWFEPDEPRMRRGGAWGAALSVMLALPILVIFIVAPLLMGIEAARRFATGEAVGDIIVWPLLGLGGALVIWSSLANIRRKLSTAPASERPVEPGQP